MDLKKAFVFSETDKGFTLVELLVALAIMSIVSVAIFNVFFISNRTYTTQDAQAQVQQSLRAAMEIMVQDIRSAGLDPTLSQNFGIEQAAATKLRFTSDSIDAGIGDFNGVVDDTNFERIAYDLQGNQLIQILYESTENQSSLPLIDSVEGLAFAYFDIDGNNIASPVPATNLVDIRAIEITLTVQEPASGGIRVRRTLTKRVKCRNF